MFYRYISAHVFIGAWYIVLGIHFLCYYITGGLDIILTPGLAFTRDGKRLGRGKGYYDNYLKKYEQCLKRKPYTIALAYYEQICETVPVTEYDVPVDAVLFQDKVN